METTLLTWNNTAPVYVEPSSGNGLRIAFVGNSLMPGGAEIRQARLAADARKRGASVIYISLRDSLPPYETYVTRILNDGDVPIATRKVNAIDEYLSWCDIVVWWGNCLKKMNLRNYNLKSVYMVCSAWWRIYETIKTSDIDVCIMQSAVSKKNFDMFDFKKYVIWNGVPELNVNVQYNTPSVMCMGRFNPVKRLDRIIITARSFPSIPFTMYGSGPMQEELCALIRRYHIDNVSILPPCYEQDKAAVLSKHNISILFSESEGMPTALLESGAAGHICITPTWDTDLKYIFKNNERGLIINSGRFALGKAIKRVLSNWNQSVSMGKKAKEFTIQHCNINKMYDKYWNAYHAIKWED